MDLPETKKDEVVSWEIAPAAFITIVFRGKLGGAIVREGKLIRGILVP